MAIKHATTTSKTDNPDYDVSADEWNEDHTIEDSTVTYAKLNLSNGDIPYAKIATSPRVCRIKTGTYTGDGSTSQAITGVGFEPKMLWVHAYETVHGTATHHFYVDEQMADNTTIRHAGDASDETTYNDQIISLDSDGFTVDDAGGDQDPNKNGVTYVYVAMG